MFNETSLKLVRSHFSFKDLCLSRRVCKRWSKIDDQPFTARLIYLDESNADDLSFRASLSAAIFTSFLCRVETQDEVDFAATLLASNPLTWLSLRIAPFDGEEMIWPLDLLNLPTKVQTLIYQNAKGNCGVMIVDFARLHSLTHLDSNVKLDLQNFDAREMEYFYMPIDQWEASAIEVAHKSKTVEVQDVTFRSSRNRFF